MGAANSVREMQARHAADPTQVTYEQVCAQARLFRLMAEAERRHANGELKDDQWVAIIQRLDYISQLLLANLNTNRAAVSALRLRVVRGY
jgi:hypothetical protein